MNYFIIADISDDNTRSIVKAFSASIDIKYVDPSTYFLSTYFLSNCINEETKQKILDFTKEANEFPVYSDANYNYTPENKVIIINKNLYPEDYKRFSEDTNWRVVYIGDVRRIKLFPTMPYCSLLNDGNIDESDNVEYILQFLEALLDDN